jgi:hypothetical protein
MARIAVIASLVIFTGCAVATWGGAYHVLNATPVPCAHGAYRRTCPVGPGLRYLTLGAPSYHRRSVL